MTTKTFREIHMNGEGFHTLGVYRLFFRAELQAALKRRADYDAEVEEWYEEGDGRSPEWTTIGTQPWFNENLHNPNRAINIGGLGYRFPHCMHGSDLTTDYDNICGGCEESTTAIEEAMLYARERFLRFNDRWDWINSAPGDLNHDTRNDLLKWAISLFPGKS